MAGKHQDAVYHTKWELRKKHHALRRRGMIVDPLAILNQQLDPIPQNQMEIYREPSYNAIGLRYNSEGLRKSSTIFPIMINNLEEQRRMHIPAHLVNTATNSVQLLGKCSFSQILKIKGWNRKIRLDIKKTLLQSTKQWQVKPYREEININDQQQYQKCQKQKMRYSRQLITSERENVQLLKRIYARQKQHQAALFSRQQRIRQQTQEIQELKQKIRKESEARNLLRVKMLHMQIGSSKYNLEHVPRNEQLYYLRNKVATQQEEYHKLVVQLDQLKMAKLEPAELME